MSERIAARAQSTSLVVERPAWSPAQVFGVAGGVVLIVIGAIGLARTGTNFSNIPLSHATATGLHLTCLSAVVQLGAGVLLLGACVFPDSAKSAMTIFGVLLVVWGIVIAADTARLFTMWGYTNCVRQLMPRPLGDLSESHRSQVGQQVRGCGYFHSSWVGHGRWLSHQSRILGSTQIQLTSATKRPAVPQGSRRAP